MNNTYQRRVIAFIDILGFRNIIHETENNAALQEKIYAVLDSIIAENINNEMFIDINPGVPESEREDVRKIADLFSRAVKQESTMQVTHFSDSIVISVGMDNDMYVMSVFEFVGRLVYRMWHEFRVLLRGAITTGELIHVENGPLFGPAMVHAYDLETNLASFPRIIIDDYTSKAIRTSPFYSAMPHLFMDCKATGTVKDKMIQIADGLEINLHTAFRHLLHSHFTFHDGKRKEVIDNMHSATKHLHELKDRTHIAEVQAKYEYLIRLLNA